MSGINGISAYQQTTQSWKTGNARNDGIKTQSASETARTGSASGSTVSKTEIKGWSPIDANSSLVPQKTDYGMTIGNVQLSDKAAAYLNTLKSKFNNMEFITVSSDMKSQVQKNAAAYGNANKMVVLIDDEKLERMATDESFRKKYEGIIAMSQSKLTEARNSLASSGADVKNFGMSVDSNGKESFFATVGKSQELQKKRIEKKAAEKKEQKAKEKKATEKKAREDRILKAREKKAEKADDDGDDNENEAVEADDREYVTIEAGSLDELFSKVQSYGFDAATSRVMADSERMVGTRIDFKG